MQTENALADLFSIGGGVVGVIFAFAMVFNAVIWLLFPWIMLSKLNIVIKHLRNIEMAVEASERNTRPPSVAKTESSVKYRIPGLND